MPSGTALDLAVTCQVEEDPGVETGIVVLAVTLESTAIRNVVHGIVGA